MSSALKVSSSCSCWVFFFLRARLRCLDESPLIQPSESELEVAFEGVEGAAAGAGGGAFAAVARSWVRACESALLMASIVEAGV